jgi:hypothetical protein
MSSTRKPNVKPPAKETAEKTSPASERRKPKTTRVILFPPEPSTIGRKKIAAAVEAVLSRRSS